MGKHLRRGAVFFDETGRRTHLANSALRSATVTLLAGVAAVVVSLLSGVPMPGVTPPVQLPSNERPIRHAGPRPATKAGEPGAPTATISQAAAQSATPPQSAPPIPPAEPTTPVARATSAGSLSPTGSPGPASTPATSHGNRPTSTPAASTHGRAPATPPGHTKHP
jgi:hypothetical protein